MPRRRNTNIELQGSQVRAAGEHYVLARLTSCGFIAGLAPENTRSIDIIAMSESGDKNLQIEVKTRTIGRAANEGWHMKKKHEKIIYANLFYVFVAMPSPWTDDKQPETFVIPSKKVAEVLSRSHIDWLKTPGRSGQKRNDTEMRWILPFYKDSPSIPKNWMEQYKDNWEF